MKFSLFSIGTTILLLMGYTKINPRSSLQINQEAYQKTMLKKSLATLRCSPDWSTYRITDEEIREMIPLPGTGAHSWKVNTNSDSAQFYFNQGINLYYGFHIIEALPSFKKAQLFDPTCAMLYWGEALAYGPNVNDFVYAETPDALLAISKAKQYSNASTEKEKDLFDAMQSHYSNDTSKIRALLNQEYADKMKTLHEKYADDAEIGALYADALMNLHPWDLWNHDGKPKPWTPELIKVLEGVLKIAPEHPGANHYYIHTMEASPFATKANASADRLAKLAPGISHMVHMPSHIYIRTGQYDKGVEVNKAAVANYYNYKELFPSVANSAFLYDYHNRHMQAACSMNANDYSKAIQDAIECRSVIDTSFFSDAAPMGDFMQYIYMTPLMTMIRFEKWDDILKEPAIGSKNHYGTLIEEFAKGMAYANKGKLNQAKSSLSSIETILQEPTMAVVLSPFNAAKTGGTVAKWILKGTIATKEKKWDEAIRCFQEGVNTEDSLVYQEPRDWLVPARHYLGNALLKTKKYKEAEKVFLKDLTFQPNNYTSTNGLLEAKH